VFRADAIGMRANQLRLYLSAMAYILVSGLRRLGLRATELAQAQVSTILPAIPGKTSINRSGRTCPPTGSAQCASLAFTDTSDNR